MAFPTLVTGLSHVGPSSNSTTYTPTGTFGVAGNIGDIIVAFVSADGAPTLTTSSTGWNKLGQASNGTIVTGAVFWCYATAADTALPTLVINSTATEQYTSRFHRFAGASIQIEGANSNGSSTNSDPPNLAPSAGSKDYYWLASRHGDSTVTGSAGPSGYLDWGSSNAAGTGGASTETAYRTNTAASENPGVFTVATEQWVCWTVAIWIVPANPTFFERQQYLAYMRI